MIPSYRSSGVSSAKEVPQRRGTIQQSALNGASGTRTESIHMVQFAFGLLTPLMFLFAVMMYFGDFRLVAVAFAAAGYISYFVGHRINSDG